MHNVWRICTIACRLFEYYLFSPSSFSFLLFLWLCAVRVHTHPWAKESKIDHKGNWSRCTGTGSSSGADLSHAGKIMHPELTTQHTRLPSTSFGNRSHNFTKSPKPGEENGRDPPLAHCKRLSETAWIECRVQGVVLGPDEGLWPQLWRFIHCVMKTAGNGITFAEGKEDNAVTPDHSLAANRTRPCQAVSASAFCCTTPPTHSTNHPLPFPPVDQQRRLRHEKVFACAACTAHRFGRFL